MVSLTKAQILRGALGHDAAASAQLAIAPPIIPGVVSTVAIAATVTVGDEIDAYTVRLLATAACNIVIAADPDVDVAALGTFLPANTPETFRIKPGYKIATKRTAGDGSLKVTVPQGIITPYIELDDDEADISESTQLGGLSVFASVVGLYGNFVFSMVDDGGGKLAIDDTPDVDAELELLELLNYEGNPTLEFTIQATNGIETVVGTFIRNVANVGVPVNTVAPTITGTAQVGATLTGHNGTWTSAVAAVYTYQWYADGVAIVGATAITRLLAIGQLGALITLKVTATTPEGSTSAFTAATAAVIAA